MFRKIVWLSIFIFSISISAQEKSEDIALITTTLENYYDGYIHRDSDLLNKAFDMENGAMKVPATNEQGIETFENSYFKDLIPKWASREKLPESVLSESKLSILGVDVVNSKIASAKISMKVGETTYIDILSLQKINMDWKITNKIFIVEEN
ncbi:MAG: nuclear transport factor 2 family protein [Flavobacteriaceae bacterium]